MDELLTIDGGNTIQMIMFPKLGTNFPFLH